jgi:hypothetical protein
MRTRRTWFTVFALAALVACQTGGGPPRVLSFTADPPAITAGGSSTLRWQVTGATTITIAPGVGDVSGTNTTIVTPATTTTYTLTASGDGGSATDDLTVTVDTGIDVAGRVLGLDGRPAPSVLVTVLGVGTVPANFDGTFVLPDVQPPYTIHVRHPLEPLVVTYVGLTIPDPVLIVSGTPTTAQHTASFYGTISGGTNFPQPASHVTRVTFASSATRGTVDADGTSGAFQVGPLPWFGADTSGAMHALQWNYDANNLPVDYTGHGMRPRGLSGPILAYLGEDMALLPVNEGAVSGTTTVPAGYTLTARSMSVVYDEGGWVVPAAQLGPTTPFTYVTPQISDTSIAITGLAVAPGGELSYAVRANLTATATGVNLVLPAAPSLVAPADTAVNVGYGTGFAWSAPSGGVSVFLVNGPPGTLDHAVVTADTSATIPDLREVGLDLAAAGAFTWQIVHVPAYASVDESATSADGLLSSLPLTLNPFYFPAQDGAWANSLIRGFTSVP